MKIIYGLLSLLILNGCSSKCDNGCFILNGEELSFVDAEMLVSQCDHFRTNFFSRQAVSLSYREIADITNNDPNTPLMSTYMSYMSISESPLIYDRKEKNPYIKHNQIIQACVQLRRDFNTDRFWTN